MQAKNGSIIVTVIICAIVILLGIVYLGSQIPEVTVPTAQDVANAVLAGVTIPNASEIAQAIDTPDTFLSLREDLKKEAIAVCDDEFDFDEVEDLFGNDDEVTLTKEYVDKRNYVVFNLGIDNVDDRYIKIYRVYKVAVEEDDGDEYNDRVYVTCKVESDDGELEADLTYHL